MLIKNFKVDNLRVQVYNNRENMGRAAGARAADIIRELLKSKDEVRAIFAAAPSQNEMLEYLTEQKDIDWQRVVGFHMDEYIGLSPNAPQAFSNFLKERLFSKLPFKRVEYINVAATDAQAECDRYSALLNEKPIDIVCMGIGENGHIAFNDPGEADFNDTKTVKIVTLDEKCRQQQVNDGCFEDISQVPKKALSLTIPALTSPDCIVCTVPAATKAQAVFDTLRGEITDMCPASILRTHKNAAMFLDTDSGKHIIFRKAIISDEISDDFEEAARQAARFGLEALEIRNVWGKAPHELSDGNIAKINEIAKKYNLKICAISSSVYKADIDSQSEIEEHYERLRKSAALAVATGARYVRGFTFWRKYELADVLQKIVSELKKASEIISEYGRILVIENEPATPVATAEDFKVLFDKIDFPNVKINWDPGNQLYFDGGKTIPYPNGYELIKENIEHVHLKDSFLENCVKLGEGLLDIKGQLTALLRDGYDGFVTLEPHFTAGDDSMSPEERKCLSGQLSMQALNDFVNLAVKELSK